MLWLYLIALAVLGTVIVVLLGRWDGAQPPAEEGPGFADDVDELLRRTGSGRITAEDLDGLVFDSAPRGYRMDQVDRLLDALSAQLRREAGEEIMGDSGPDAEHDAEAGPESEAGRQDGGRLAREGRGQLPAQGSEEAHDQGFDPPSG